MKVETQFMFKTTFFFNRKLTYKPIIESIDINIPIHVKPQNQYPTNN